MVQRVQQVNAGTTGEFYFMMDLRHRDLSVMMSRQIQISLPNATIQSLRLIANKYGFAVSANQSSLDDNDDVFS